MKKCSETKLTTIARGGDPKLFNTKEYAGNVLDESREKREHHEEYFNVRVHEFRPAQHPGTAAHGEYL